jgi:hypothetical protein
MWKYCNGCVQWGAPKYAAIQVYKDIGHTIMGAKGLAALGLARKVNTYLTPRVLNIIQQTDVALQPLMTSNIKSYK